VINIEKNETLEQRRLKTRKPAASSYINHSRPENICRTKY